MLEVGGGLDLGEEAVGTDHGGQLWLQDLERDLALVAEIVRKEDGRHPALADLAVDLVATVERRVQPVDHVRHVACPVAWWSPAGIGFKMRGSDEEGQAIVGGGSTPFCSLLHAQNPAEAPGLDQIGGRAQGGGRSRHIPTHLRAGSPRVRAARPTCRKL